MLYASLVCREKGKLSVKRANALIKANSVVKASIKQFLVVAFFCRKCANLIGNRHGTFSFSISIFVFRLARNQPNYRQGGRNTTLY